METIKNMFNNVYRVTFELLVTIGLGFLFFEGLYEKLSNPMQLILLKIILISVGILHAHFIGKFFFTKVNWNLKLSEQNGSFYVRTALYILIPICYAMAG